MMRQDALKQLKEILLRYPPETLDSQLSSLLHGIAALSLDKERDIRRDSLNALSLILSPISNEYLTPFHKILISHLSCAMTHIDPNIKEDSLRFLDVLEKNCKSMLLENSHVILPNFLGMICRLHGEIKPGRQLMTTVNSKNTSAKWRIKVLERLGNIFTSVVAKSYEEFGTNTNSYSSKILTIPDTKQYTRYAPVYLSASIRVQKIDLDTNSSSTVNCAEGTLPMEDFLKYVNTLMPLMLDIWLEVCPNEKLESYTETTVSSEAFALLKNIVEIIQSITDYIDMLNSVDHEDRKCWFKHTFHNSYIKNFLSRFPYRKATQFINESRRRQEDFSEMKYNEKESCLEQNLGLCQIHILITSFNRHNTHLPQSTKDCCTSIVKYINGILFCFLACSFV